MTARVLPSLGGSPNVRRVVATDGTYLGCLMSLDDGHTWDAYPARGARRGSIGRGTMRHAAELVAGVAP